LGVSQQQIFLDLREAKKEWRQRYAQQAQEVLEEEVARLSLIEREFWQAWNKSKPVKESTTHKTGLRGETSIEQTMIVRESSPGNPSFLNGVLETITQRLELMGITTELKFQDINAAVKLLKSRGYRVFAPEVGDVALALHALVNAEIIPSSPPKSRSYYWFHLPILLLSGFGVRHGNSRCIYFRNILQVLQL